MGLFRISMDFIPNVNLEVRSAEVPLLGCYLPKNQKECQSIALSNTNLVFEIESSNANMSAK